MSWVEAPRGKYRGPRVARLLWAAAALALLGAAPGTAAQLTLGPASLLIQGQESLTFRAHDVSGSEPSRSVYRWENASSSSGFEHRSDLVIRGSLLPGLTVDAAIARGPYLPGRQRLTFTFDGADAVVKLGDLAVAFDEARLAGFRRSLRGVQVDSKFPGAALTLIASQSKPAVRADTLYGRNSAGPYYLTASPIVDASEVVEVDGRRMQRGADYSIDYQVGLVQFSPALIIAPTSRITVSYEYEAADGLSGNLIGLRASAPVSSGLRVGATYLTLQRRSAPAADSATREDRWLGNNSAGPFTLTFRPIEPGSERVRLDGILQVAGRDYRLDYATGSLFFLRPVPAGVFVIITYRVTGAPAATSAERSLIGLDAHYSAGRHLAFDAEFARSIGGASPAASGSALALGARGNWERLSLSANLRRAAAGFGPFESPGSDQVRRGYDCALDFNAGAGLHISAATRDYERPYYQYAGLAGLLVRDRSSELKLDFRRSGWPSVAYTASWSGLNGSGDNPFNESSATHLLLLDLQREAFGVRAAYRRNAQMRRGQAPPLAYEQLSYGSSAPDLAADASDYAGRGEGAALNLWYRPGSRLSIVCDLARSSVSLADGASSGAASARIGLEYLPAANTTITFGYRAGSSGDTVSADGRPVAAYSSRSRTLSIRHAPTRALAFDLTFDSQMGQGGYSTNSRSDAWSMGVWWQAGPGVSFTGQYAHQDLAYLGASGRSSNNIASLGEPLSLFNGAKLDLSYSRMSGASRGSFADAYGLSGGLYGQTGDASDADGYASLGSSVMANSSLRARLTYPLAPRHHAFVELEKSSSAGYPGGSRRSALALGWEVRLARELSFTLDWRRIASDSSDPSYSYRAQTLSGQLGLKF